MKNLVGRLKMMLLPHKNKQALQATIAILSLFLIFSFWVHHAFQGQFWGPFLPGSHFGIPEQEAAMGMYPTSEIGWDAQFYYYQSNDLFARGDAAAHIDNPAYRYQRIGAPLLSGALANIFFLDINPPFFYHFMQFLVVGLGFYVLLRYLRKENISSIYAYAWLLSAGVVNGLYFGMPDAVGDAFFIIALVAALQRKLLPYVIAATFLLLVREGYAVFAAIIFLFTFFGKIKWAGWSKLKQIALTMLPGVVVVLWMGYVTSRFGITPIEASKNANLTDWPPLVGAWKTFVYAIQDGNVFEVLYKQIGVVIVLLTIGYSWLMRKKDITWYAVLAYTLLISLLGTTVWGHYSGYMKAMGTLIIVLIIAAAHFKKHYFLKALLVLLIVQGIYVNYPEKSKLLFLEHLKVSQEEKASENADKKLTQRLGEYKSEITSKLEAEPKEDGFVTWDDYDGLFDATHIGLRRIPITIKNTSDFHWYPNPQFGENALNASYQWYSADGLTLLHDGIRTPLTETIDPGEAHDMSLQVKEPPDGDYTLRISLIQEGQTWFYHAGGGELDVKVRVE